MKRKTKKGICEVLYVYVSAENKAHVKKKAKERFKGNLSNCVDALISYDKLVGR